MSKRSEAPPSDKVPTDAELRAVHCLERSDKVAGQPEATAYRRTFRLRQARWREAHGHPIGRQPIRGGRNARLLGSRLEFEYAVRTGANFLTPGALQAARARMSAPEPFEALDRDRLWADLLSSMPLAFNVFGDLQRGPGEAMAALRAWGLEPPGRVREVRFEWSPGRRDPSYLNNQSAFDVAFVLDSGTRGRRAVIGVETKYHEAASKEKAPSSSQLDRYLRVMREANVHKESAERQILDSDLQQLWLDHLLALSLLSHVSRTWDWVRFVLVYPSENVSFADAARRYRELLKKDTRETFVTLTVEELLAADVIPRGRADLLRERYLQR